MPVRSLSSSVLRWPDNRAVDEAARRWAAEEVRRRKGVLRVGYFGSYARGDWGVGSDLDLLVVVDHSDLPFQRRFVEWDTTGLPVPADLLVYTREEWQALAGRFRDTVEREAVWLYPWG
jgi:predicted nucleotidyltransferase